MKEFSNLVKILPLGVEIDEPYELIADSVNQTPVLEQSEFGTLWNCGMTLTCDLPEDKGFLDLFRITRSCIVTLRNSLRQEYTIGSNGIPARVTATPLLNKVTLRIECKQMQSPFAQ